MPFRKTAWQVRRFGEIQVAMDRPLNILHVLLELNLGGVQQCVLDLCRGLDSERFRSTVCAVEYNGVIGKEIAEAGFEVVTLGFQRQPIKTIGALYHMMRERQIDIVHAVSYHSSLYARIAGVLARVPVLISHEQVAFDHRRLQRVAMNKLLAPFTTGYIACGELVARQVREWYGYPEHKIELIYNGVDTDLFRMPADRLEAKAQLGFDGDRPVVGMVARLDPEKGHQYFFDAIKRLINNYDAQWVVVGSGRGEKQVLQEAREAGIVDRIEFLGARRDLPELLAGLDVYVLPSVKEGFPITTLNAMAAGCAVVVSDYPANLEAVEDGVSGCVVPMRDGRALADVIAGLLDSPSLRNELGGAARNRVEAQFSVKRQIERIADYYERLWRGSSMNESPE